VPVIKDKPETRAAFLAALFLKRFKKRAAKKAKLNDV
jgi:hypothetical protein